MGACFRNKNNHLWFSITKVPPVLLLCRLLAGFAWWGLLLMHTLLAPLLLDTDSSSFEMSFA